MPDPLHDTSVRRTVVVDASQEKAFSAFTEGHDRWWPRSRKIGTSALQHAVLEPRQGGRWYERDVDGIECDWGRVLVWEPPSRLVLAWQVSGEWAYDEDLLTEVEVRFIPLGLTRTRVELEHRGLDAYDDRADEMRGILDSPSGWGGILERFAAAVSSN